MASLNSKRLKIAVIIENKAHFVDLEYSEEACADVSSPEAADAICEALEELGHDFSLVPHIQSLVQHLAEHQGADWDLVFNASGGFFGSAKEAQVPALLEAYQIPFTFSDAATMALCSNKAHAKIVLAHNNIPTAPFAVVLGREMGVDWSKITTALPAYPVFAKPACEGAGKGIGRLSKVKSQKELEAQLEKLQCSFPDQNIILEPFLAGRDLSVSIFGTGSESRVVGVLENLWKQCRERNGAPFDHFLHFSQPFMLVAPSSGSDQEPAVYDCGQYAIHQDLTDPQIKAACEVALDSWKTIGCRDAGRVDIRFDSDKEDATPNVLEINPIAGLCPGYSMFPQTAKYNGISFTEMVAEILESALRRPDQRSRKRS